MTAKSSELNVVVPQGDDFKEHPLPEQFVSKVSSGTQTQSLAPAAVKHQDLLTLPAITPLSSRTVPSRRNPRSTAGAELRHKDSSMAMPDPLGPHERHDSHPNLIRSKKIPENRLPKSDSEACSC